MKIGPHEVSFKSALPLTLGDWKRLEALGVTPQNLSEGNVSVSKLASLILVVAQKANKEVTEADVDALTFDDSLMDVFREIGEVEGRSAPRPT